MFSFLDEEAAAQNDEFFQAVYEYENLSDARYRAIDALSDEAIDRPEEETIINLQNHLIWGSYDPGEDPDMDTITLTAIDIVRQRRGLRFSEIQGRAAIIVAALLTV